MKNALQFKKAQSFIFSTVCLLSIVIPQESMAFMHIPSPIKRLGKKIAKKVDFAEVSSNMMILSTGITLPTSSEIKGYLTEIIQSFNNSYNLLEDAKQFLSAFLTQTNANHNTSMDMQDLCHLLRQNIDILPRECHGTLWNGISALESDSLAIFGIVGCDTTKYRETNSGAFKWIAAAIIAVCITTVLIYNPALAPIATPALLQVLNTCASAK